MRILLWHGYLMTGSGSNVYTANIAREWRNAGHDVVVMCQQDARSGLPFVDEILDTKGDQRVEPVLGSSCRIARPFIDGLLPVYVYDDYEGFVVKTFLELSDVELDRYTDMNVQSMASVIESFEPEAIITGHEVMGPYIAYEACRESGSPYLAKLHGSALEYAVKKQDRYQRYAQLGLGAARHVVGGSEYMVREASRFIPGWEERAVVVNPGCDVELFQPAPDRRSDPPVVGYVGKLMASKGVHHLLAGLGLLSPRDVRVVVVGYGGFEDELRALVRALKEGDIDAVRSIAERGEDAALTDLLAFLESGAVDRDYFARVGRIDIEFTGRLEHGPLSDLLPTFDVLAVPSVVPEAFGMVAAEAAACGVLPVVPDHSGIGEAGAAVEDAIGSPGLLTFSSTDPIRSLASRIDAVLSLPRSERDSSGRAAAALARSRWSWRHVADRLLSLAS